VSLLDRDKRAIKATIINEVYEALSTGFAVQHEARFKVLVIIGSADKPTYFEVTVKEKKNAHSIHLRDRN